MSYTYRLKHALFPRLIPVVVPVIGVPVSLATAWTIHAGQRLQYGWHHHRNSRNTPTSAPQGAGGQNKTQDEAVSRMPLGEFNPLRLDGYTSTGIRALADFAPMYFDSGTVMRGRLHLYPRHFHETLIPVSGGTPISGIVGLHHSKLARPGLVVVHGLMNSKRQDLVRVVTLKAYYEWGFNVCAIDMRGFGRSAEFASAPTGAGGIEAGDLLDVIRYLKKFPHFTSMGLLGFSLGGAACLNAAAAKEAPGLIDGGVFTVSSPIDLEMALFRFEHPPEDEQHLPTYHFFRYLLSRMLKHSELMRWARKRMAHEGGDPNIEGFYDFLRNVIAWGYMGHGRNRQRDPDRLLELLLRVSSPSRALSRIKVPTFILASLDDPMVRMSREDIALLERVSHENPHVRYHLTERGGHTAYVAVDAPWFYKTIRAYFTYWGRWETVKRHPFQQGLGARQPAGDAAREVRNGRDGSKGKGLPVGGVELSGLADLEAMLTPPSMQDVVPSGLTETTATQESLQPSMPSGM